MGVVGLRARATRDYLTCVRPSARPFLLAMEEEDVMSDRAHVDEHSIKAASV